MAGQKTTEDQQLEEVQAHIDEARRRAEADGLLPPSEPQRTWRDPDGDGDPDLPGPGAQPPL